MQMHAIYLYVILNIQNRIYEMSFVVSFGFVKWCVSHSI